MAEHRYVGVEAGSRRGVVAVCACGWRSAPFSSAGLAGSAWDEHQAAAEEEDGGYRQPT